MPAQKNVPKHIAIVMDGNGRWAHSRGLERIQGHYAGVKAARNTIELAAKKQIDVLTMFAFSSENWQRPAAEVNALMALFLTSLRDEADNLNKNNVRLRLIGDIHGFNSDLQQQIREVENLTASNNGLTLIIAANYSGRWDMLQATRILATKVRCGEIEPDAINIDTISQTLCLHDLPEPDLFIRTSGEQRISNFLLWQLAYTELYFTEVLWPDFGTEEFEKALAEFAGRKRRFGLTEEQVT